MLRARTLTLVAATVVGVGSLTAVASADVGHRPHGPAQWTCNDGRDPVVGTWRMSVKPADKPAFDTLVSFQAGGTMSDSISQVPPFAGSDQATSGLGAWTRNGNTVSFTFERFLLRAGGYVARQQIQGTAVVTRACSHQDGTAVVTFTAPDHTQLAQGSVTTSGDRLTP